MKIIVGLGNPGREYEETRHNVGFRVVERLAARHGIGGWRRRFRSLVAEGRVERERVMLMKPQTFMNESGRAVRDATAWCDVDLGDVMIVCDDFNLSLGRLRVRGGGSSGGHNGLGSISEHLGGEEIPRLRVGIGSEKAGSDRDFVLSRFAGSERDMAEEGEERAARALEVWLESGLDRCQNEFNMSPDAASRRKNEEADG